LHAANATAVQRKLHGFEYRKVQSKFKDDVFKAMNDTLDTCKFDVRTSPKASVETDIIITEGDIPIDSKGRDASVSSRRSRPAQPRARTGCPSA